MIDRLHRRLFVFAALACTTMAFLMPTPVRGDDAKYRMAMARATREAAGRVLPSVVTIEIVGTSGAASGEVEQDAPTSGILVDASGLIIGSSIVVRRPSASILVVLPDGSRHASKVVARDHHRDLVLLKIKTDKDLTPIELPSELNLRVGQTTVAVGRYGVDASPMVSGGVLSAMQRLDGIALQTDARVSPALYGGPLVDLSGNVLGVLIPAVAAGGAPDATSWYDSGIAFAIPADVLKRKVERLREGEDIKKGLIGIVSKSKDPYENVTEIAAVRTRSPAEAAGIKAGDKILSVDNTPVRRHQEIRQVLGRFDAGDKIAIKLQRDGKEQDVEVTLADTIPPLQPQRLGVIARQESVDAATDDASEDESEQDSGDDAEASVIVEAVLPGGPAAESLQTGDVLLQLEKNKLRDVESFRRLMISAEPEKALQVTYRRGDEEKTVEITPANIAGKMIQEVPQAWTSDDEGEPWQVAELKLPDVGNAGALLAPKDADGLSRLGLLVLLLNPGQGAPDEVLKDWTEAAKQSGVVICAVAPENNSRWQPKELEVVGRFAASAIKKAPIDEAAVAVAAAGAISGGKAEAADAMALAVAVSQSKTFFGVAISPETRPPAMRLRENQADASLQLLLPVASENDLPGWSTALAGAGYPVVLGGELNQVKLLRWVRLLQAI